MTSLQKEQAQNGRNSSVESDEDTDSNVIGDCVNVRRLPDPFRKTY